MDFTLKDSAGQAVKYVSETQEPIQLWLSVKDHLNKTKQTYSVKNSIGTEHIRYHRVSIPSDDEATMIEIQPEAGQTVEVYVSANVRPTPESYNFSLTLPRYSSCKSYSSDVGYYNCTSNPYMFALTSKLTGSTGPHYVGIRYVASSVALSEKKISVKSRVERDCCVGSKDPPAPSPPPVLPIDNGSTDVSYTMSVKVASCKYWSEEMNKWISEGCEVRLDNIHEPIRT